MTRGNIVFWTQKDSCTCELTVIAIVSIWLSSTKPDKILAGRAELGMQSHPNPCSHQQLLTVGKKEKPFYSGVYPAGKSTIL